jgi:PPP family 3-phenylpropionic acid transporter
LPLFWYADALIKRFGHYTLIVVSESTCLVRLWVVYMIPPHYGTALTLVLCSQMLHGLSFALFWAAAVDLMSELSPPGMKNGCMASLNMLYYTVGGAIGSFGWGAVDSHFNGGISTMYEIGTVYVLRRVLSCPLTASVLSLYARPSLPL